MRYIYGYIIGLVLLVSCDQITTKTSMVDQTNILTAIDSNYAVIKLDSSFWANSIFSMGTKSTGLTIAEIEQIDPIITKFIQNHEDELLEMSKYKRQYLPVITGKGEKIINVLYFCDDFGIDWKNVLVEVDDGGKCYFSLRINMKTQECFDFYVNSEA